MTTATVSLVTLAHIIGATLAGLLVLGLLLAAPIVGELVASEVRWRRLERDRARYWSGPPAEPRWMSERRP